jgi:hypothetical protein
MEEIPTNRLTPKFDTFPTDSLSLRKEITDQPSDINYADRRSIGDVKLYRPTSVGNAVLWCSGSQCAGYSSMISDLETRLNVAKRQAQKAFDKASKTSNLTKQVSVLDDKVSSLMAKILHHEECNTFVLGIIESAYEMLRCKFPFDLSSSPLAPPLLL